MLPGLLALGAIQNVRYGSPLGSGYGAFQRSVRVGNIGPNLARYPRWLTDDAHAVHLALAAGAAVVLRAPAQPARSAGSATASCVAVFLAYLPYVYFRPEEWFYTRFLLPGYSR